MCGQDRHLHPPVRNGRRRSADLGGLSLAMRNGGHGKGWLGNSGELQTRFAELLSDMYTQTLNAVNEYTVDCVATDLSPETRAHLIASLDQWNFEPALLQNEDHILACAVILFEGLFRIEGMEETVGISFSQIPAFIQHLRQIYRWQNSYHNFDHALDVLQASYSYLRSADMVPPLSILLTEGLMWKPVQPFDSGPLMTSLGLTDLFIIYIAAIGHDVGHPGFTNLFMNNAATPLSVVFDGKSALERMHGQLLLRVMRHHGLGRLLDDPKFGVQNRKLLWETVLATDMSVHDAFMQRFQDLILRRGDDALVYRRITICQAIIKCADISNPSRPYYISQHWATALMREWNSQAILEKHHQLPTTVESSDHPLKEVHSQIFFIPKFAKPLLDLTVQAVPEMQPYAAQCDFNLVLWTARLAALQAESEEGTVVRRRSKTTKRKPRPTVPPRQPDDYNTAFPLTLPVAHGRVPSTPPAHEPENPIFTWSPPTPADSPRVPSPIPPFSRPSTSPSPSDESQSETDSAWFTYSPGFKREQSTGASSMTSVPPDSPAPPDMLDPSTDAAAIRAAAGRASLRCRQNQHRNSWSPQLSVAS
ncbi:hypothetical protein FB45DRAFT_829942 [Roridomyces roridus]|uniref:Phosphodiesterase n=1 Tax=Roridomyces roridus TaxID=1738132 RepID=A0AAD7BYZ3_9AGAR|nr:hypothetical protein FB45DRAFT_829942 [Roridomyces roridus]